MVVDTVGAAVQGRRNFYADRSSNLGVSGAKLRVVFDGERLGKQDRALRNWD